MKKVAPSSKLQCICTVAAVRLFVSAGQVANQYLLLREIICICYDSVNVC